MCAFAGSPLPPPQHPGNILVQLDLPFGPLNPLVRWGVAAGAHAGLWSPAALDSLQHAELVLLDAGMAMRLSRE